MGIKFICGPSSIIRAQCECTKGANDATGAQKNYMPDESCVIFIIITAQGQIVQNIESFIERSFSRRNGQRAGRKKI